MTIILKNRIFINCKLQITINDVENMKKSNKEKQQPLKSFETGNKKPLTNWVAEEYTPHYLTIPNVKGGVIRFF